MLDLNPRALNADLTPAWLINGCMVVSLIVYVMICHTLGDELKMPLDEEQRLLLRTIFYLLAIIILPLTNLMRYILLRLNQTMPIVAGDYGKEAKKRYITTVLVSLALTESIGIFGLVMFLLGDSFNTLYIFIGLSALGLFLHRPKTEEYARVVTALAKNSV